MTCGPSGSAGGCFSSIDSTCLQYGQVSSLGRGVNKACWLVPQFRIWLREIDLLAEVVQFVRDSERPANGGYAQLQSCFSAGQHHHFSESRYLGW